MGDWAGRTFQAVEQHKFCSLQTRDLHLATRSLSIRSIGPNPWHGRFVCGPSGSRSLQGHSICHVGSFRETAMRQPKSPRPSMIL